MVSVRKKWCFVAGKGEWVRVKGFGYAKREKYYWNSKKYTSERKRVGVKFRQIRGWKLDENKINYLRWGKKIWVWLMAAKKKGPPTEREVGREKREMLSCCQYSCVLMNALVCRDKPKSHYLPSSGNSTGWPQREWNRISEIVKSLKAALDVYEDHYYHWLLPFDIMLDVICNYLSSCTKPV